MSRVGKYPVKLADGVTVTVADDKITVKGKLGELSIEKPTNVTVEVKEDGVWVAPMDKEDDRAIWGTTRANINNMVKGVSAGFTRKLELIGVGYKAQATGKGVKLSLGFSHDIDFDAPAGIKITCPTVTEIEISGIDKRNVGMVASEIRSYRPPEPYKGKGVKYAEETVLRKEGKKK